MHWIGFSAHFGTLSRCSPLFHRRFAWAFPLGRTASQVRGKEREAVLGVWVFTVLLFLVVPLEDIYTSFPTLEEEAPVGLQVPIGEDVWRNPPSHFPMAVGERAVPPSLPERVQNLAPILLMEEEEEEDEEEDEDEGNESACTQSAGMGSLSVIPIHYYLLPGIDQEPVTLFADQTTTSL